MRDDYTGPERRLHAPCQQAISDGIRDGLKDGIVRGVHELAKDQEFIDAFWSTGFDRLTAKAHNNTSQWIGSRILTWLFTVLALALVGWLIRSGALK